MRLWLPLQIAGIAAFRACQAEKLTLARYFYRRMSEIDGFVVGPSPDLSIVAFRYVPKSGEANEFTERLLKRIQQEGRVMLSGTRIDGTFHIRCAILSFRTHIEHVDEAIDALVEGVKALDG
jgi:glutamate/tyrosine decarboxylase-like PLP-dependent enzyme